MFLGALGTLAVAVRFSTDVVVTCSELVFCFFADSGATSVDFRLFPAD
jgi:hypothetical protein